MSVVSRFTKKIKALEKAINPTIKKTIDSNKNLIIGQQTDEQLYEGQDSEDKEIRPKYALSTKIIKRKKGQPIDRVTLKDSGDLYKSITVNTKKDEFIISANVEYFKYLVTHYSSNKLLGLNQEFLDKFTTKKILPNLEKTWKDIIRK
jgi:phage gpG-like protein